MKVERRRRRRKKEEYRKVLYKLLLTRAKNTWDKNIFLNGSISERSIVVIMMYMAMSRWLSTLSCMSNATGLISNHSIKRFCAPLGNN